MGKLHLVLLFTVTVVSKKKIIAHESQYLLREIRRAVNGSLAKITLRWISSHSGVKGNEKADRLAKEAAAGRSSLKDELPPLLRTKLLISAAAAKQAYVDKLKVRWKEEWSTSPRRARTERFDTDFPFNKYRGRQDTLRREHASVLMQVRLTYFPLNRYLHRIGKTDTGHCRACAPEPGEETPLETLDHFLFDCKAHDAHRRTGLMETPNSRIALSSSKCKAEQPASCSLPYSYLSRPVARPSQQDTKIKLHSHHTFVSSRKPSHYIRCVTPYKRRNVATIPRYVSIRGVAQNGHLDRVLMGSEHQGAPHRMHGSTLERAERAQGPWGRTSVYTCTKVQHGAKPLCGLPGHEFM